MLSKDSEVNPRPIRNHGTVIRKLSNHLSAPVVQVKTRVAPRDTQSSSAYLGDFPLKAYPESSKGNNMDAC